MPARSRRWWNSACCAAASLALASLGAALGSAAPAAAASAGTPDRANVGATHSPELLRQLASRAGAVPLTGTGEMGPAVLAPAAVPGDEQGVDVASFQHPGGAAINWPEVAASGIGFAAVKATEGAYYKNKYALTDLAQARAAGLSVVAYAFAVPDGNGGSRSPVTQADYLLNYLGSAAASVPVMLDIEYNPYSGGECYGLKGAKMVAWVAAFDAEIRARTGRMPVLYTPPAWWGTCAGGSTGFGQDPLWVPSITAKNPVLPAGWGNWTIWQYSGTGTVSGISDAGHTDLDQANAAFLGLLNPGTQAQTVGAPAGRQLQQAIPAPGQAVSYTAAGLPPGLSLTAAGDLTGWLTRAGTYLVRVSASDAAGATGSLSFRWAVGAASGQGPAGPVRFGVGGKCLNDLANEPAAGTPVTLLTCNGSPAQEWTLAADRTVRIHGQCLSVAGPANVSGARAVLARCAGDASQQWAVGTGAELVNGAAGKCLSGSATGRNGSRVRIGPCSGGASRAWTLPAGPVQSQLPGLCLAQQGGGPAVVISRCDGLAAQQWTAQPDRTVRLAGSCLAVAGGGTASGTSVGLGSCTGGAAQRWRVRADGAGQQLENPSSGLCLADPRDARATGTQLVVGACAGGDPGTGWRLP